MIASIGQTPQCKGNEKTKPPKSDWIENGGSFPQPLTLAICAIASAEKEVNTQVDSAAWYIEK